jgi:hypothetical protein
MIPLAELKPHIQPILQHYQQSFSSKTYTLENDEHDVIMDLFGVTPCLKRENRQYWGRELGMCWQSIVAAVCKVLCSGYKPAQRFGLDEPFDLAVDTFAIDTKYRIGSGDAGTLKKMKQYGSLLKGQGYDPVLLIVRDDNLSAALTACRNGGWRIYQSAAAFAFIMEITKFDLLAALQMLKHAFCVTRS